MDAVDRRSRFWDRMAERYARQPIADEAAYQKKLAMTRAHLRPEMELFEFGCGTGGTAILHAPHVRQITAIDFSETMLEIARDKVRAAGVGNIAFQRADILGFVPPAAGYDMVLGLSILHLLAERDAVIAKVFAMLKPGGLFVSSTACIGDSMPFLRHVAPLGRALGLLPVLNIMTGDELRAALTHAGFTLEEEFHPGRDKALFLIARKPR